MRESLAAWNGPAMTPDLEKAFAEFDDEIAQIVAEFSIAHEILEKFDAAFATQIAIDSAQDGARIAQRISQR